ncbi:MAG: hypothetical protein JWP88_563 [Flaviaesturariibacter sp.]|nr:hypothetical protein [Flaviaesturariibacter sp.]
MKQTTHPNFILGIVSLILLIIGAIMLQRPDNSIGRYILFASIGLGAIHWLWSIIDVFKHQNLASQSRVLWGILVIAVPPVGGILYYAMSKTVRM